MEDVVNFKVDSRTLGMAPRLAIAWDEGPGRKARDAWDSKTDLLCPLGFGLADQ